MNITDGVPNYRFFTANYTPILPFTYDDCLSYLETLYQFSEKLNEIIDTVNATVEYGLAEAKAYTDQKIAEQTSYIDEAVAEVNRIHSEIETEFDQMMNLFDAKIQYITDQMTAFEAEMRADVASANHYTDLAIEQNNEYILQEMVKFLGQIKVINWFTGNLIPIQGMFDFLAILHTENSIIYSELALKEVDYDTLRDYHMTYTQLTMNGGSIIQ